MREETRPILGPVLGIIGGGVPAYWAVTKLWILWRASPTSSKVQSLVGSGVKLTPAVIAGLRSSFAAVVFFELAIVVASLLLLLFPRRHYLTSFLLLLFAAVAFGLVYTLPYSVGVTALLAGQVVCPVFAFLAGISGLVFRSDLEFARAHGLD